MSGEIQKRIDKMKKITKNKMGVDYRDYVRGNYHPHCIENLNRILRGEGLTEEMEYLLKTWNKDRRTSREYFLDILYGWIAEDYVHMIAEKYLTDRLELSKDTWSFTKAGSDKYREFKLPKDMKPDTDLAFVNKVNGKIIGLEVVQDHNGYIVVNDSVDLRHRIGKDSKFKSLLVKSNSSSYESVYLLVIDHQNQKVGLVPINNDTVIVKEFYNEKWGKMATRIRADYNENFCHMELKSV